MISKNKRRSQSVEHTKEAHQLSGNKRNSQHSSKKNVLYKSQSNKSLKAKSEFKNLRGKSSVLNRPGTFAALSALSMGGFSQNISSNTLRNSHSQWSFSKADRFKKLRIDNSAKMLCMPSTLNTKTSTFGYGSKQPLKIVFGKDSPPPTLYRSRSQFDYKFGDGKSIGISYKYYNKVHMPGLNTRSEEVPGPGSYDSKTTLGQNSRKFTLKSRIKPADSATRDNPPPNNYDPNHALTENSDFEKITFGFGGRPNVTGRINENPGPGTYKIPSVFDKFQHIPNASLLKTLAKYRKQGRRKIAKPIKTHRSSTRQLSSHHEDEKESDHKEEPLAIKNEEESNNGSQKKDPSDMNQNSEKNIDHE